VIERRIIIAATIFVFAVTGLIVISVRGFGIGVPTCITDVRPFRESKVIPQGPKRYEVHYVSQMWNFEPADLAVEPGSTVDIYLSTKDVTHGMQIVGTNVNLMAVPGAVNYARVKFDKPGDYLVVCNEYCGVAHHNMAARIHVSEQAAAAAKAAVAVQTQQLLDQYGCTACHSIDGSASAAPTFKGLFGTRRTLANGTLVIADESYLRQSIEMPEARVVKGFDAMPPIPVPPGDEQKIIEIIKGLR
jgi:cytochrome c oxidase subunit 2